MWREIWADPLCVYCDVHFLQLLTHCPACDAVPYASPTWATTLSDQLSCTALVEEGSSAARYRRRCGARLDRANAPPARDLAVEDQAELFRLAVLAGDEPHAHVQACGIEARAGVVFEAALEMIEQATGAATLPVPAESTHAVVDAIRGVTETLRSSSLGAAYQTARAHGLVWRSDALIVLEPRGTARAYRRNPLITAMWLDDLRHTLGPDQQLRFRMGGSRPRYPDRWQDHDRVLQSRDAQPALPISMIPQLAWPGALELPGLAALGLDTVRGRAFVSMCLAKYGSTRPWREIATGLGLPAWSAARLQSTWHRLAASGQVPAYLSALDTLFRRLHDAPPPIDYEMRRIRLWNVESITAGNFIGRIRRRQPVAAPFAEVRRRFWAMYTGGAEALCPPSYATDWRKVTRALESVPERCPLVGVEDHLPDGFHDGPLTWAPP